MLENYLVDLKASLTASPIIEDIEIADEFITSVSGFLDCRAVMLTDMCFMLLSISLYTELRSSVINIHIICKKMMIS